MNSRLYTDYIPLYAIRYTHRYYKVDYRSFNPNAIIRTLRGQYYRQFPLQWLIKFHGELNRFARARPLSFPRVKAAKSISHPVMWAFA